MIGEGARLAALGDGLCLSTVGIDHAHQFHFGLPGKDSSVLLAQVPNANDSQGQSRHESLRSKAKVKRKKAKVRRPSSLLPFAFCLLPSSTPPPVPAAQQAAMQHPGHLHVERMARTIGDDVSPQVGAEQRQIANQVEHLVPGRLVGESEPVVDRPVLAEHQQIGGGRPRPQSLAAQVGGLLFEQKRPAAGNFADEGARRELLRVQLPANGRRWPVVEEVGQAQTAPVIFRRVQGQGGSGGRHRDRLVHAPPRTLGRLIGNAGGQEELRRSPLAEPSSPGGSGASNSTRQLSMRSPAREDSTCSTSDTWVGSRPRVVRR